MRFTLSVLLASALALPVLAQPPRVDHGERERPMDRPGPSPDVERLTNRIKELEKQLAEAKGKKDEGKKEEKKPEGRKPEGDRKPAEVQPQPFPPREGPQSGRGGEGPQFGGRGPGEGGNPFGPGGPPRDGQPRPMGGGFGGGIMMSGGGGGGVMSITAFPGMDALNKDEHEMFQKLLMKMRTAQQKPAGKPNVEERLERLENMMQKLMQKLDR